MQFLSKKKVYNAWTVKNCDTKFNFNEVKKIFTSHSIISKSFAEFIAQNKKYMIGVWFFNGAILLNNNHTVLVAIKHANR